MRTRHLAWLAVLVGLIAFIVGYHARTRVKPRADVTPAVDSAEPRDTISQTPSPDREVVSHQTTAAAPSRQIGLALAGFGAWAEKFANATGAERAALIPEGEALAKARRDQLKTLMQQDPEAALAEMVPYSLRKRLPDSIKAYLEVPVSARGKVEVVQYTPLPGYEDEVPATSYRTWINHELYTTYYVGAKPQKNANGLGVVGMSLDNVLLNAGPRILDPEEKRDLVAEGKIPPQAYCPISNSTTTDPTIVDIGRSYETFCTPRHAKVFQSRYAAAASALDATTVEQAAATAGIAPVLLPPTGGRQGRQKLLVIPVAYADDPRAPSSQDALVNGARANNQYYEDGSYGTVSFISTITPLMTLPERRTYYGEFLDSALWSDAVTVATAAGYNPGEYDFIYVVFNPIPGVKFGGRSDGLLVGGVGAISHELGHNFGLAHANYWNVGKPANPNNPNNYPFDRDSQIGHYDANAPFRLGATPIPIEEYGNPFDVMGSGGGHFSASSKNHMNWLPDKATRIIPTLVPFSETNRVYAFDTPHISPGRIYALRIRKNANEAFLESEFSDGSAFGGRVYWATYRQGFPANPWLSTGIQLNWDANGFSRNTLVDVTANSAAGKNDSAVTIGRTFVDPEIPLFLTPIAQGGGPDPSDKWIDVVANIGPFPTNLPPVMTLSASALAIAPGDTVDFTVTATDPNGDVVAYNWDFGDGSFGFNSATNSKTFPFTGQYVVRCEVSDMKGGIDSAYVVVTVGVPTRFAIRGHVVDINGNPLQGVRVHNGGTPATNAPPAPVGYPASPPPTNSSNYAYTYTDSQGSFTLANLDPGSYDCGAYLYGYKIAPQNFENPIVIEDGDAQGLTFVATPITRVFVVFDDNAFEAPPNEIISTDPPCSVDAPCTNYSAAFPGGFFIYRNGDLSDDLPVRFALGGTAQNGVDYESIGAVRTNVTFMTNGSVITTNYTVITNAFAGFAVIPAGEAFVHVKISPIDNDISDGARTVRLSLMLATNDIRISSYITNTFITNGSIRVTNTIFVTVTNRVSVPGWETIQVGSDNQLTWFQTEPPYVLDIPAEATLYIFDDEPPQMPVVSVFTVDSIATETANDCGSVTFTRYGPIDLPLTVYYAISGTASNGVDYVELPGVITIPAGQQSVNLPIVAINDLLVEGDETVQISVLDDPNGSYLADLLGGATVFIVDDDLPQVSIYASDSTAGKTGNNNGTVTIVRAGDLSNNLVVNYLVTGTAISGVDYNTLSGSVTIPAGRVSADVTIVPITNSPSVGPRTVTVVLSDSESYNIDNLNKATVTIQENLPVVTLRVDTATIGEGSSGSFTVTRFGSTNNTLNVRFAVGGSAVELYDYAAIGTNVVVPAGATTATITINSLEDQFREKGMVSGDDQVIIQLLSGLDYNLITNTSGAMTITDNEPDTALPLVSFMLSKSSGWENSEMASIAVRISANPPTNKPVIVNYKITGGTAVQGVNYSFIGTGRLDFVHFTPPTPPDPFHDIEDGIQFIDIPILDDGVAAGDKNFTITLFNFTGFETNTSLATNTATMPPTILTNILITPIPTNQWLGEYKTHTFTILDIGATMVNIEALTPVAYEEGAQPAYLRLSRTGTTNRAVTVRLAVSGTAASGSDFVALPSSVTIPAGTNAVIIPVIPLDDPEEESEESVVVTVLQGPGFSLGSSEATVTIIDNDGTIQFTKPNFQVDEGAGEAVVDVIRTGNTNRTATVDYQILDGTATLDLDYMVPQTTGTLFFAAGETMQQIHIAIVDDLIVEPAETISLVLTNPTGGLPLGGQRLATLTINDNDISFQFVTNSFQVNENGTNAVIIVERLGLKSAAASVVFRALTNSATDADFVATNITLSFDPGETNKTVLVAINDDEQFEGDELVNLVLEQPSTNASVGPIVEAALTIRDDECAITFESPVFSTNEYAGFATVVVRRIGGTINPVSVNFATSDGSANSTDPTNADYLAQSGVLNFAGDQYVVASDGSGQVFFQPGDSVQVIRIPLIDDTLGEGDETFTVTLSDLAGPPEGALPGATIFGSNTTAVVTIIDDETPGQVDSQFRPNPGANDTVRSLAVQADGAIVFGGDFTTVNGIVYRHVARLHPDGNLDASFNPGAGIDGPVFVVASQPDQKVLVGGTFTRVNNIGRTNFVRLNANGSIDLGFIPGAGPNNAVRAVAVQSDGKILIGGDFTSVSGAIRPFLARLQPDGSMDSGFAPSVDSSVYSIALQQDGKIVIAGAFVRAGGARAYIARLNANGSIDNQFDTGAGPNNAVNSVAIDSDGKIVLGGLFTSVNGIARGYVARLTASGSVDTAFDPGFGANANVNSVAVGPAGKIVVGGDFTIFDGSDRNRFARLRPSGALDLSFSVGSGADSTVNAVAIQSDSGVVIGGAFTNVAGLPRYRIARVHGDDKYSPASVQFDTATYVTSEDAGTASIRIIRTGNTNVAFDATFQTTDGTATVDQDYSTNHVVLSFGSGEVEKFVTVTILQDSKLELDETVVLQLVDVPSYVDVGRPSAALVIRDDEQSVQFARTNYTTIENSNVVVAIVRTGPVDSELSVTYYTVPGTALAASDYVAVSNTVVFGINEATQMVTLSIVNDSRKELAESFDVYLANPSGGAQIGINSRTTITIIDDDLGPGSVDTSFSPVTGPNGFVKAVAVQPDGTILIGGGFTSVDDQFRNRIARLNTNGPVDLSFDTGLGANGLVTSIAVQSNGKIAIAGAFTSVNSSNRNRAAQLFGDGRVDSSLTQSNGLNAAAYAVVPVGQNKLLIGGSFTIPVHAVGRLRTDGTMDTSFFPGLGANGAIYSIAPYTNGNVVIAGDFTTFNGSPRSRVARLGSDGVLDGSLVTASITTGAVQCVALQADGKILIGGDFIRVGAINRGHLARLQSDGALDTSFSTGGGANGTIYSIVVQRDGKAIIGGSFTSIDGIARNRIARLNTNGSVDLTFDPGSGADGTVYAAALQADEHVIIGGDFNTVNGLARRGVARLNPDDVTDTIMFLPGYSLSNGVFQVQISCVPGVSYALEATSDFNSWVGLSTNVSAGATLNFTDNNATSNHRFYRVRQVSP